MKPLLNLFFLFVTSTVSGQELYPLKLNPFLVRYLAQKGYAYPLAGGRYSFLDLRPWADDFRAGKQELIRTDSNLYVFIGSTSRVYKAVKRDSQYIHFQRIDSTLALFYNIGSYQFTDGEDIYSYGGYGFWKNNGLLRKFNFRQGHWDVVPLDREITAQFNPAPLVWYDPKNRKLHIPFQQIINEGVKQIRQKVGEIDEDSWVLDLATRKWNKNGKASPTILITAQNVNPELHFSSPNGLMIESIGQLLWLDYNKNSFGQSGNEPIVQTFFRNIFRYDLRYQIGDSLFFYNTQNQLSDAQYIGKLTPQVVVTAIERNNNWLLVAGGIILIFSGFALLFTLRKKREGLLNLVIPNADFQAGEGDLVTKNPNGDSQLFNVTEIDLIKLCLERSEAGVYANLDDINYVLGIKNKKKGLQKKVRSDVINSINKKYRNKFQSEHGLINSVRNADDKRYFDYFIDYHDFEKIKVYLIN
jgi:LPXTG-motif cell wall-anchored protein